MEKLTRITGVAAPLPMTNVDTDRIIPARFLKTIKRTGLGKHLFSELRFADDGSENPDFVLNQPAYREARVLIAGENFGCGSSREHAPWALRDFGIRCIIAESFADIFFNNCFKNGILAVKLPRGDVARLMNQSKGDAGTTITVDLETQEITEADARITRFDVEPFRRHCLLAGLDDIGLTLGKADKIDAFEARQKASQPWLYP